MGPYAPFESMRTTTVEDSTVGLHGSLNVSFMFARRLGAGVLLRYSRGSIDLPNGTREMTLGGLHAGVGARARF